MLYRVSSEDLTGYNSIPAWHMRRVENVGPGLSAVIFRIHHVLGDGISLMYFYYLIYMNSFLYFMKLYINLNKIFYFLSIIFFIKLFRAAMTKLFEDESGNPLKLSIAINDRSDEREKKVKFGLKLILDLIISAAKVLYLAISPYDSDLVFTSKDKPNLKMTKSRKILYFPTLRLDFVKTIKNKAVMTINDVLLSATTGALRRYCLSRNDPLLVKPGAATTNRALIPVAFPRSKAESSDPVKCMRNKWAFVRLIILCI